MSAWQESQGAFSIVLPTLKEKENILPILERLTQLYPGANIIVVDDNSEDGTAEIARNFAQTRKGVKVIKRDQHDRGLTASICDGITNADTRYFIVMDADFQHPPESVAALMQELLDGSDMVIGVRKDKDELPVARKMASVGANVMAKTYLRAKRRPTSTDTMSGFFGGSTEMCQKVIAENSHRFERSGFKALFDLLKFLPRTTRIAEVEFVFNRRRAGESKLSSKVIISIMRQCGVWGKLMAYTSTIFLTNMIGRFIASLAMGLAFTFIFINVIGVGVVWNSTLIMSIILSLALSVSYIAIANKMMFTHGSRQGLILGLKLVATGFSGYLISLYIFYMAFSTISGFQMMSIFIGFGIGYVWDAVGSSIHA